MGMVDIHNHLIYKFDDGPQSLKEAAEMLQMAAEQGITDVFATSHFNEVIPPEVEQEYFDKLQQLREEALVKNIPVFIYSGAELFYHHFLEKTVQSSKVCSLGNLGKYLLIEFPLFLMPTGVKEVLFNLSMNEFIPIIAHPERYQMVLENPDSVLDFIRYGALLQVNAGSVLGEFGKEVQKISMTLLENGLVHFVASDAHNTRSRAFKLEKVAIYLSEHLDKKYVEELVEKNPRKIIDEEIIQNISLPEPKVGQESLFKKLIRRLSKEG